MFFFGFDDNIVDIFLNILTNLVMQAFLHAPLICHTYISQTEWHSDIAISPVRGNESSLYLIIGVQWDLVKTRVTIKERQQLASGCGVDHLIDLR